MRQPIAASLSGFRASRARSAAALVAAALVMGAGPAFAADVAQGRQVAQRWCATCHVVAPDQAAAASDAPSFAAISASRKIPEIRSFLSQTHPKMPDMNLTRNEIADLIAYMQTLAPPADPPKPTPEKDDAPKTHRG